MRPDGGGDGGGGGVGGGGGGGGDTSSPLPPGTAPPPDADAIELYDAMIAATAACAAKDDRCSCGDADWGCGAGGDRSDRRGCAGEGGCPASVAGVQALNGGVGGSGGGGGDCRGDSSCGGGGGRGGSAASGGCFGIRLRRSLDVLGGALRLYGTGRLAIAFNGGKDATVILHLMRAAVAHHRRVVAAEEASLSSVASAAAAAAAPPPTTTVLVGNGQQPYGRRGATLAPTLPPPPPPTASPPILSMYITDADAFDEVESFVRTTAARYGIEAVDQAGGFKAGIEAFVHSRGVAAFVLGTRRDDPHGGRMEHFEPSSVGWPPFMRVNAILDWTYGDVWRFLRRWRLPYAPIYDRGYTSLGGVSNTVANPKLLRPDGNYAPAYCLDDAQDERAGDRKSVV